MSVTLAGVPLKNPILTASGTFGFGREYAEYFDIGLLGGISVKGLTLRPRPGNPPPRVAETPGGMLNSVGLQNPGAARFLSDELPRLRTVDTRVVANISGNAPEEFAELAAMLTVPGIDIIEVNISCPNIQDGGILFGSNPRSAAAVTAAARRATDKPLFVKLAPGVADIAEIARAVAGAGADGLSLINTLPGMRIDVHTRRPILRNNIGGLSGPAALPVAVRAVWQVRRAVDLPIIGMGGVCTGEDAAELLLAGADAVAVGTAMFMDPTAPVRILGELESYCERHGVERVRELTGAVAAWE